MSPIYIVFVLTLAPARPHIILEYRPIRTFYYPSPGYYYIRPVTEDPLLDSSNDNRYFNEYTPPFEDRIGEETTTVKGFHWAPSNSNSEPQKPQTVLEYNPTRPFYHPGPNRPEVPNLEDKIKEDVKPPTTQGGFIWESEDASEEESTKKPLNLGFPHPTITLVDKFKGEETPSTTTTKQTPISLEYQPNRPSYHPNPGNNVAPIIPPGQPWPAGPQGYQNFSATGSPVNLIDRFEDEETSSSTSSTTSKATPINLGQEPSRPPFHPNPGNNVAQIIPPGEPWPDSPEGYQNFSQITSSVLNLVDRQKDDPPSTSRTTKKPSLEYTPTRPFHAPKPGATLSPIIPPGKPWPDSPEGYSNFSQISSPPNLVDRIKEDEQPVSSSSAQKPTPPSLEYNQTRPFYAPNPGVTVGTIIKPGQPWPDRPEGYQNFSQVLSAAPDLEDRIKEDQQPTTHKPVQTQTPLVLGYQPTRPFYAGNGVTLAPIIPPGKPWPDSPEGYEGFSQLSSSAPNLVDRIKEDEQLTSSSTTQKPTVPSSSSPGTSTKPSLEYTPTRPFHAPKPGVTVGTIIKPGQPWPDSPEGYHNFSQTSSAAPDLGERIKEDERPTTVKVIQKQTPIVLGYQPTRPFHAGNQASTLGPIIPPGKPWPDSPEGYQGFSQLSPNAPNLEERVKEDEQPSSPAQKPTRPSLEYKPTRPFYAPNGGVTVAQIIPPSNPENGQVPNIEDRINVGNEPWPGKTTTQAGFLWETETSSEISGQRERLGAGGFSTTGETSTLDAESSSESRLFTSSVLKEEAANKQMMK